MKDYQAIIFDFGGVIINIDYQKTIDSFQAMGIDNFEDLYSQAAQESLFDDIETGRISAQHFVNGLLKLLPAGTSPNQVVAAWNAMIFDVPKSRIEMLKHLRKTHKVFLLSNTNEIHIAKAYRNWDKAHSFKIRDCFDQIYLSHEVGMRKPNAEIFDFVCEQEKLIKEKTLFIDDSIQHIKGAKAAGLKTHFLARGQEIIDLF